VLPERKVALWGSDSTFRHPEIGYPA
jgi:hypothetical protein